MSDAALRYSGWQAALQSHSLEPGPVAVGDFRTEGGYRAVNALLQQDNLFTALFAANDRLAMGAILALYEQGLRVPQDISVVGYDDISDAQFLIPPLTTVRQDLSRLGQLVTEQLIAQIDSPDAPEMQQILLPELIMRSSTARLR